MSANIKLLCKTTLITDGIAVSSLDIYQGAPVSDGCAPYSVFVI